MSSSTEKSFGPQSAPAQDPFGPDRVLSPLVSVIVPTYCEAENLKFLVPEVSKAMERSGMSFEMLIVDDNSPDETVEVCERLCRDNPVRLLVRTEDRGLSSAVVHGLVHARGSVLLVMDADLSHPPEKVPELVAAVLEQQGDFVIGSRYVPGGSTDDQWGLFRWLNSKVATWLARGLTSSRDPMAGFFALSRQTWENAEHLSPIGYKIGLELIVKCGCRSVAEVPIHFRDRVHGESKLSLKEQLNYVRHLGRLYKYKMGKLFAPLCFAAVGLSGAVVDLVLFTALLTVANFGWARGLAIFGAMTWNFFGNRHTTFAERRRETVLMQYAKFVGSCLVGGAVSWGVSSLIWQQFGAALQAPQFAAAIGILAGAVWNYLLSAHFVFRKPEPQLEQFLGCTGVENMPLAPVARIEVKKKDHESSAARNIDRLLDWRMVLGGCFVAVLSLAITSASWQRTDVDGLDQAHNIVTSYFFHDLATDKPFPQLGKYTYDYQRQYPALGLLFWPPLFHLAAGGAMFLLGPSISTVYLVLTGFALVFAVSFYAALTRTLSPLWATSAVALAITAPVLFDLQNTVMLEVPALAVCGLVLWLYLRLTQRGEWNGTSEAIVAGISAAAIAYAKQPAVFVLLAIFLDVLVCHRQLLTRWRTWVCVGTAGLCLLPLAVFTLKYGDVNMAQAFGNDGNIYVEHHRVADRWSWEGWTYYLGLVPAQLGWGLTTLVAGGLALIANSREAARKHGIWLFLAVAWYVLFSYFDNKQVRFVAFVIPVLTAIAVIFIDWLWERQPHAAGLAVAVAAFGGALNLWTISQNPPQGYVDAPDLLAVCAMDDRSGNLAYFGEDHHLFTAHLREADAKRKRAMVRGDLLLSEELATESSMLGDTLAAHGVRWIMVDPDLPDGQKATELIEASPEQFQMLAGVKTLDNGKKQIRVAVYEFNGLLPVEQKQVTVRSETQHLASGNRGS